MMKRWRNRHPLWWKSSGFLFCFFFFSTLVVLGVSLFFLYEQRMVLDQAKDNYHKRSRFIQTHQEVLSASYSDAPQKLGESELERLQTQVPLEEQVSYFLVELEQRTAAAGVTMTGVRFADSPEELEEMRFSAQEAKEKGDKRTEDLIRLPLLPKGMKALWADMFIEADEEELDDLFQQLHYSMDRLVTVRGWDYLVSSEEEGHGSMRIRLTFYVYKDDQLLDLPKLELQEIETEAGKKIEVEEKEKQIERDEDKKEKKEKDVSSSDLDVSATEEKEDLTDEKDED
ncbi:hypothetical protein [Mechercharimyces sp. CAU 1602]|uniref:hypothetical protein n=1 Tax=Mechercharimyces sp. CAU 1602 TaxID=2973933 RepID=UPI0021615FC4|nr:hypothetical protein [Mechercharimyces sp. CAU 1602]MCS1351438.1 hypothetical protein [Mechercharimyces sp. CAU 1602]